MRGAFFGVVMGLREVLDRAGEMPHRKLAGDNQHDARLSSEIGRLYFGGSITKEQYEAGVHYANLGLLYLETIDAPPPYGGDMADIEPDAEVEACVDGQHINGDEPFPICFRRKIAFAAARKVLKEAGKRCVSVLDRVGIYDEPVRDDLELHALRVGLSALCGDRKRP